MSAVGDGRRDGALLVGGPVFRVGPKSYTMNYPDSPDYKKQGNCPNCGHGHHGNKDDCSRYIPGWPGHYCSCSNCRCPQCMPLEIVDGFEVAARRDKEVRES